MIKIRESIQAGTYEMPLFSCVIRQCDAENPLVFTGSGLVCQDADKRLVIKAFAEGVDLLERMRRDFSRFSLPGQIIPDSAYYDFRGIDLSGEEWVSNRISIHTDSGDPGTFIKIVPLCLEKLEIKDQPYTKSNVQTFTSTPIELPWHLYTSKPNGGFILDRFEGAIGDFSWKIRKKEGDVEISFTAESARIQNHFTDFRRALAILVGRYPRMELLTIHEENRRITRLHNTYWEPDDAKLLTPLRLLFPDHLAANDFLCAFMLYATKEANQSRLIYQYWHRILRARENDIENSALVLTVSIEGLIKSTFANEHDVDADFLTQVMAARPLVKAMGIGSKAKNVLFNSLGNASNPTAKNVLHRLLEQGAITDAHLSAWKSLRNTAAHGGSLENDGLQAHLDRYHTCLNLFYRLIFLIVGYEGQHTDYSLPGWPETRFPGANGETDEKVSAAP